MPDTRLLALTSSGFALRPINRIHPSGYAMPTVTRENLGEHRDLHTKNNSWWLSDVRGIPLTRVCEDCIDAAKSTYKPEVLGEGEGRYEDAVEDQIEDDY